MNKKDKLSGEEIIKVLEVVFKGDYLSYAKKDKSRLNPVDLKMFESLGPTEDVDIRGGEGEPDFEWQLIRKFTDHDVFIKTQGYYNSYSNLRIYTDEIGKVVKPKTKTITVFD